MRKFIRTHARAATDKGNGHANGGAVAMAVAVAVDCRRDGHSTATLSGASASSSKYWSSSECDGSGGGGNGKEPPWEDPEFPASWRALGDRGSARGVIWKRPHEVWSRPTFGGADEDPDREEFAARWRVSGGALGEAHLAQAAAAVALTPRLLARVMPPQRVHPTTRYTFRFWVWGTWRTVQVDDRLPWRDGRAAGACGGVPGDCALPLLEKAYAKLYGSYRALRAARGGSVARALRDLTGGCVQALPLPLHAPGRALLARVLHSAVPRCTLVVARGAAGRLCVMTGLARMRGSDTPADALVRLRVLSGPPPTHDRSPGASCAPAVGDYWVSLGDAWGMFSDVELVHVGPDDWMSEPRLQTRRPWRAVLARRRWRPGYNAGGPPGARTAHANPRFHVSVPEPAPARCHLVVSLTQRYEVGASAPPPRSVGFVVYAVEGGGARTIEAVPAGRAREHVLFLALPPGRYQVVPHTADPHTDHAFLLRILTDTRADVWEVNDDNAVVRPLADEMEAALAAAPRTRVRMPEGEEEEVDAARLRALLGRSGMRCSTEVCRALVALRDAALTGLVRREEVPALAALAAWWRHAYAAGGGGCSYGTRALLSAAGVRASNKVVECVVARWGRGRKLPREGYVAALARLHLAHERHRALRAHLHATAGAVVGDPLSLEEMILMTVYA